MVDDFRMERTEIEKATYDPDLPHDYLMVAGLDECGLCGRARREELHLVQLPDRQRASTDLLVRELGT